MNFKFFSEGYEKQKGSLGDQEGREGTYRGKTQPGVEI